MCATVRARRRAMQTPASSRTRSTVFFVLQNKQLTFYFVTFFFQKTLFCSSLFSCLNVVLLNFLLLFGFLLFGLFAQAAIWATHLSITQQRLHSGALSTSAGHQFPTDRTRATRRACDVSSFGSRNVFFQSEAAPHEEPSGRRCVRASECEGLSRFKSCG